MATRWIKSTLTFTSCSTIGRIAAASFGGNILRRDRNAMADERDREMERLRLLLKWAQEENLRLLKLIDDAVAQLREAHAQNNVLRQQRVDEARAEARVVDAQAEARI